MTKIKKRPKKVTAKAGTRVRLHRNLHNGLFVVSTKGSGGWRVNGYAKGVTIRNVRPRVGKGGYETCHQDQVRNVHAYLEGDLVRASARAPKGWRKITYSCKNGPGPFFYYKAGETRFEGAGEVRMATTSTGKAAIYAKGKVRLENPPACPCADPGGLCGCGMVDGGTPPEDVPTCGSWAQAAPPSCSDAGGAAGVVVVPAGDSLCMLDVAAVARVDPARFWADSCPCVLGYSGPSGSVARPGWGAALDHAGPRADSPGVYAWLCTTLGGDPGQVEQHLLRNGEAWLDHELGRAGHNPLGPMAPLWNPVALPPYTAKMAELIGSDPGMAAFVIGGDVGGEVSVAELLAYTIPCLRRAAARSGDDFAAEGLADLERLVGEHSSPDALLAEVAGARNLQLTVDRDGPAVRELMVHPATRPDAPAGSWQATEFGLSDGSLVPYGHQYYPSVEAAIRAEWREYGPLTLKARANPPSKAAMIRRLEASDWSRSKPQAWLTIYTAPGGLVQIWDRGRSMEDRYTVLATLPGTRHPVVTRDASTFVEAVEGALRDLASVGGKSLENPLHGGIHGPRATRSVRDHFRDEERLAFHLLPEHVRERLSREHEEIRAHFSRGVTPEQLMHEHSAYEDQVFGAYLPQGLFESFLRDHEAYRAKAPRSWAGRLQNPYVGFQGEESQHYVYAEPDDVGAWREWFDSQGQGPVEVFDTIPQGHTPAPFVPSLEWVRRQLAQ